MNKKRLGIIILSIALISFVLIVAGKSITSTREKSAVVNNEEEKTQDYSFVIESKDYDITITDKDALLKVLKEDFRLFDAINNKRVKIIVNRMVVTEDPKNKVTYFDVTDRKNNSAYTLEFNIPYFYLEDNTKSGRKLREESLQDIIFSNLPSLAKERSPELSRKILIQGKIFLGLEQKN
ncbi:MAG: hypothetical protein Q7T54_01215 [Candidatus Levybacteria bacterium]|nr:hypothetical protein [Candidatus Levybacteria bacterium]